MDTFEHPADPQPRLSPAMMVGAASPLWAYYGAAAAGAMTYWWMTRWARPANLEAMMAAAFEDLPQSMTPLMAPVADTAEAFVEVVEAAAPDLPDDPVGGEAAPVSPLLAAPAPVEAAPAPAAVEEPPLVPEPPTAVQSEEPPKARPRKAAPAAGETDAA